MKKTPRSFNSTLPPPKAPLVRSAVLPKRNEKRARKAFMENFGGEYAEWIRTLPCAAREARTRCWGAIEAAHARSRGAGGTARDLVPLCWMHHSDQHFYGVRTFEALTGTDLKATAARLWSEYHGGEW